MAMEEAAHANVSVYGTTPVFQNRATELDQGTLELDGKYHFAGLYFTCRHIGLLFDTYTHKGVFQKCVGHTIS